MGFSTSAVVVIFLAFLLHMASMFYPMADMSNKQVQEAKKNSNELWNEKLNTKIVITNWDQGSKNLTVFNNGSMTLDSSKINIILNGKFNSSYNVDPQGIWPPKTSINVNIGAGSGRVKIITANGAADYYNSSI
jgi:archaellum component FlaF (FlaF/FlaG flagellin family)